MARDLTLSIDIGTGSGRAALVGGTGEILHIAAREHDQIVPQFGWAEQRPLDWWAGVAASVREALAAVEDARPDSSSLRMRTDARDRACRRGGAPDP